MARQLDTIMFERGQVRHYAAAINDGYRTLCGETVTNDPLERGYLLTTDNRKAHKYPTCKNCNRVRAVHDVDTVVPDATTRTIGAMRCTEIPVRAFRVQGSTDTYTVTIPIDPYLATLCTCMAGKVHPDKQCKHQVAVLNDLVNSGELIG